MIIKKKKKKKIAEIWKYQNVIKQTLIKNMKNVSLDSMTITVTMTILWTLNFKKDEKENRTYCCCRFARFKFDDLWSNSQIWVLKRI